MAFVAADKEENLHFSFLKLLKAGLSVAYQTRVNWAEERWSPGNLAYWAEVDMVQGPVGRCDKPWIMQVTVYWRPSEDELGHGYRQFLDAIRNALNVTSANVYDFGTTDITRASPSDTGYDFYPVPQPSGDAPDIISGNISGRFLRIKCYSVRPNTEWA